VRAGAAGGKFLYVRLVAAALFVVWLVGKFVLGKEGFVHILLLCAVAVGVVQFVHERRAARQ
jgi:Family of unknown function (DUF5670)